MTMSRRTLIKAGAGAVAAGWVGGDGVPDSQSHAVPITIAGGQSGGFYLEFARLLATTLNTADRRLNCTPLETNGSVENIELIRAGGADIGIAQADSVQAAVAGESPFESAMSVLALGRVYQDYLQLVVLEDARLFTLRDLVGKTFSLGPEGSGTTMFGKRLIGTNGLRVNQRLMKLGDATAALENGKIDALLWLGGVPTPALARLHKRHRIRLLPTAQLLDSLRRRYGTVYRQAIVPFGAYRSASTATVGEANLLVCAETLADDIAATMARVLIKRASDLVPPDAVGAQFLDSRTLIGTLGVTLHPGAADAYRQHHG